MTSPSTTSPTQAGHAETFTAQDGTTVALDPHLDEATLRNWRQAALTGGLPEPGRRRWQQLRAGVVNMWEFDVAEYWSADGRAQFIGKNEQGKSTMMAMTSLTMLTGDLSPRYVDTFGNSKRSFRYYLIPTEDPKDRRPVTQQLNRGWTWVEYGRLTETGPEYFTTLLFVQGRRTTQQVDPTWVTHQGPERVRAGLTLVQGQAVVQPTMIMPGLVPCKDGTDYKNKVATSLFGFSDPSRLKIVIELLKTLRTPKLGNQLDPGWVVDRIRESLPPLETSEIHELADGWDQLGQLARDRDDAREAQEAVKAYLQAVWNPWADAVLRRAADELVAAVTAVDDVTRERNRAQQTADEARSQYDDALGHETNTKAERTRVRAQHTQLIKSTKYRDADAAGKDVTSLTELLQTAQTASRRTGPAAVKARETATRSADELDTARGVLAEADRRLAEQADLTAETGLEAGLPDARAWVDQRDTERLEAGVDQRLRDVHHAQALDDRLGKKTELHERAQASLAESDARFAQRKTEHTTAQNQYENAEQSLSDDLEAWATGLAEHQGIMAPPVEVRERWLDAVQAACTGPRPVQVLRHLVGDQWLTPALEPVNAAAVTASNDAKAALAWARDLDEQADNEEARPEPVPVEPGLWRRRPRPASGPDGAPLWELLDPLPHLTDQEVAGLEAALAGAGLLDAWVTPDGIWAPGRDGEDHVVTMSNPTQERSEHVSTLGNALGLAEKAHDGQPLAELAVTARSVLDVVRYRPASGDYGPVGLAGGRPGALGSSPRAGAGVLVGVDGSWVTPLTSGRAPVPVEGASLLGASARAQARARTVAALREQAGQERNLAAQHGRDEERHRALAQKYATVTAQAPDDVDLVTAARDLSSAVSELDKADEELRTQAAKARAIEAEMNQAHTALVAYAAEHTLVVNRLRETEIALNDTRHHVERLLQRIATREREQVDVTEREATVDRLEEAAQEAEAVAVEDAERCEMLQIELDTAKANLTTTHQEQLDQEARLRSRLDELEKELDDLNTKIRDLTGVATKATTDLEAVDERRLAAEQTRTEKLTGWWVTVDAGLAAARGIDVADESRTLTSAVGHARALRTSRKAPRGWPDSGKQSGGEDRERILGVLRDRLSGPGLMTLNNTLDRTGGRSASVDHDEATGLPQVRVRVDASGTTVEPVAAVRELENRAAELGAMHDEKMHEVMQELLASTFVDHLRAKVKETARLITDVNTVLDKHPTGTTRTVVRLQRKPVPEHVGGFQVLQRLLNDGIDSPVVQDQVQTFLATQIRAAQEEGHASGQDWKALLVDKLDYRNWFAVVTEWRVLASAKEGASQRWNELTAARHSQDSGGAKVMTMLQPLLATLATLFQTSRIAPRPLWLDEAFDGLDQENSSSLLAMLVEFEFDFVLAGPKALVASREVPCAAVWTVNRAPAPIPGVDLGLWLFAGGTTERIEMAEQTWSTTDLDGQTGNHIANDDRHDGVMEGEALWT
ncbi:SbcC/MukB-like Walker B domain-containing protein [Promicromonospora sp. NPDC057138]|uniref:SbcC/MukB-like Walker B domain-containing protein n=1 Tax=Promicromonospora sp. NPDC057138 TaxID=3346031 RepID=UPI003643E0D8